MNNYDMKGIEKKQKQLLKDFGDIPGVEELSNNIIGLLDSVIYGRVYEASVLGEDLGEAQPLEVLLERYPQNRYAAKILKDPPVYIASLTGVIISTHFLAITGIIGFIHYAHKQEKITIPDIDQQYNTLTKLMVHLDAFDQAFDFEEPDEEYYQKLKKIKWNKKGKKLFQKLNRLHTKVGIERFKSDSSTFGTGEDFALTFLAACNSVNHNRSTIETDDVVMAYETYLKLLNTDIGKL